MSGRTLRLSQLHTTALFPRAFTETVTTKAALVKFTLADETGRAFNMSLVFKRYTTGCAVSGKRHRRNPNGVFCGPNKRTST